MPITPAKRFIAATSRPRGPASVGAPGEASKSQQYCSGASCRPRLHIIAELSHDLCRPADIRFAESDTHGRSDRKEPGAELAVAHIPFGCQLHKLRTLVLWIIDEFDEALGRELICQPLNALTASGAHLRDLRHSERNDVPGPHSGARFSVCDRATADRSDPGSRARAHDVFAGYYR